MTIEEMLKEAISSGPFAAIAIYLVVKQSQRIEKLEDYCKTVLVELLSKTTEALGKSAKATTEGAEAIRHCKRYEEDKHV